MLSTFNRNKTKLTIAAMAAGLSFHLASFAQAANDSGTLVISGQISASTCVLSLGDGASTASGSKTLSLGTFTTTAAGTTDGGLFGTPQTAVFSILSTSGSGAVCTLGAGNTLWDITLAPNLGTTFAIVEVPKGQGAGVLGSAARVNSSGFAVVPYLSAYYMNDVQISLEGAPDELEIDSPNQKVAPVEGSIVRLTYKATTGRPIFIALQTSTGVRLPIGATVSDAAGNEVGTVGQGGRAMVRVQTLKDQLKVVWGDEPGETCLVSFTLDETTKANANGFTHLKLRCEVAGAAEKTAEIGK